MPRRETRGSQLNSLRWPMSFVSRTFHCYRNACVPRPGRTGITSPRRDLTAGTATNGPACALPCLTPEPVAATCSRPRGSSPHYARGRQQEHEGRTDLWHRVARSRVKARAEPRWCSNSHRCGARERLRREPQREQPRGFGGPYLAARKSPAGDGRPIAPKRLAQNRKLSLRYPLLRAEGVE